MAKELARATGESVTAAVSEAIRERLERVRSKSNTDVLERVMKVARETARRLQLRLVIATAPFPVHRTCTLYM